ncbi:unnamed protein product [Sympodiomycopsis kandeliae]
MPGNREAARSSASVVNGGALSSVRDNPSLTPKQLEAGEGQQAALERKLGWHEKFNVMRHNTGEAPIIVLAARLGIQREVDHVQALKAYRHELLDRIEKLLNYKENGLLRSSVQLSTTKKPRYRLEDTITAEQVLHDKTISLSSDDESHLEKLVQQELDDAGNHVRLEDSLPLWSVSLYTVSNDPNEMLLALSIHHAIADGKGSQAILDTLLFGCSDDLLSGQINSQKQTIPPSSNKTLPMNPPFFKLIIPLALTKYVMPHLAPVIPPKVRRMYNRKPAWPALRSKPNGKPSKNEPPVRWLYPKGPLVEEKRPGFKLITFHSMELIQNLKAVSKLNGVQTIHPTLHTLMVLALGVSLKSNSDTNDWVYASETPINHRTPSLNHGVFTGNYIGAAWWRSEIDSQSTKFWDLARDYSKTVSDEKNKQKALITIGLLKYLKASPENKKVEPSSTFNMIDQKPATGWEKWWHEKSNGRRPHRVSAGISNLGVNDLARKVVPDDAIFAKQVAMLQCPSAIGPAIDVDVMGFKGVNEHTAQEKQVSSAPDGGLSLFVSWRQGVMDAKWTETFVEALDAAGHLAAQGALAEKITMGEAVALIQKHLSTRSGVAASRSSNPLKHIRTTCDTPNLVVRSSL